MGLTYAYGSPGDVLELIPASAFTRGDLICLTSASSASRISELAPSGSDIFGVAEADSSKSINNKVPIRVPGPDTVWLCSAHSATGSGMTTGQEFDFSYGVGNGGQFVTTSTDSVRAVVVRGTIGAYAVDQSVVSQVYIRLIGHAGNIDIS